MPTDVLTSIPSPASSPSTLLLLADGRFPSGAHAHSGGLEAAVAVEGLADIRALEDFLSGRAHTTGRVAAAFAAAACAAVSISGDVLGELRDLDREFEARTPSSVLRVASRRLGRQLLRAARSVWPHQQLDELAVAAPGGLYQPLALGTVAACAGLDAHSAAAAAAYESVAGPAAAAVRLLGLDPFAVHGVVARMAADLDALADEAAGLARVWPAELPAWSTPLLDILAEHHATWEVRLFAT